MIINETILITFACLNGILREQCEKRLLKWVRVTVCVDFFKGLLMRIGCSRLFFAGRFTVDKTIATTEKQINDCDFRLSFDYRSVTDNV